MKQLIVSLTVVLIAAGILTAMVMYTVLVMRTAQMRVLTGESVILPAKESVCIVAS